MNTTTLLIVVIVFAVLIITALIGVIVYMLFFRKVPVVVFGANGMPNEITKAKKKRNRLDFGKGINLEIVNNYIAKGKKRIYFVQKIDERTFVPFSFVSDAESIKNIEVNYNYSKINKEFTKKLKAEFSTKYKVLLDKIDKLKQRIEFAQERIDQETEKINSGDDKFLFFIDRERIIKNFKKQIKQLNIKLSRLKKTEEKWRKLEEKKIEKFAKEKTQKIKYAQLGKVDINYNILSGIADSYEEGAIRFKFGLDKFAPFITIALVALICVLGVAISMKYATQITPVEADAMKDLGQSMKTCAQYVSESQKTNLALAQTLKSQTKEVDNTPK